MKISIEDLGEPDLEFGQGELHAEPKRVLPIAGPFASELDVEPKVIRLGLVALPSEVSPVYQWFEKMHSPMIGHETNALRFREFPGAQKALRCRFEIPDKFIRRLNKNQYDLMLCRNTNEQFEGLLKLYSDAIKTLFEDQRPDCVLVCFPEEVAALRMSNPLLTYIEQRVLERVRDEEESAQGLLFEPTPEERRASAELLPQAEELLFRNFHRALKAECMNMYNAVPLQVIRRQTYVTAEAKQSDSTRAWNLGLALYYKAGNIPWRPAGLTKNTCFVGISFHHLKRRSGDLVYASVAQAFTNDSEPFVLKGETVPRDQSRNKQPYLLEGQASNLIKQVVDRYSSRMGFPPARVVVHKTSRYQPEEELGFRDGLRSDVAGCELVWMSPTGFRLLRRGMREPLRGTLCTIEGRDHYLFTTGYVPWWSVYPGPHIPSPLEIGACGDTNLVERAKEILSLTKMNWNSADGIGRHPISVSFARRVGTIMTEMKEDQEPNPLYRFYM
jgi:hypothetical protein